MSRKCNCECISSRSISSCRSITCNYSRRHYCKELTISRRCIVAVLLLILAVVVLIVIVNVKVYVVVILHIIVIVDVVVNNLVFSVAIFVVNVLKAILVVVVRNRYKGWLLQNDCLNLHKYRILQ